MGTRRGRWSVVVAVVVGVLLLPLVGGVGSARAARDSRVDSLEQQGQIVNERASGGSASAAETQAQQNDKMDGALSLVSSAASGRISANAIDVARARDLSVVGDSRIRVEVESRGPRAAAVAAVQAVGGTVESEYQDLIVALVAPNMLEALAASPAVAYVREPARGQPEVFAGEGVGASGAAGWQAVGLYGQGVKVGVIDAGFTGYQSRIANGDLPPNLTVVDFCGGNANSPGLEHGAAVAEVVYEMAPGIQLYLLCADLEAQVGQAKDYAKANGISILVMSVSYFNTGRGDGTGSAGSITATVNDARANGIFWVNAAGNRALQHYSATFNDSDGDTGHNYTSSDNGNTIFLSTNQRVCAFLRWDSWPATNQDLNLQIQTSSGGTIVASSNTRQNGSQ